MGSLGGLSPGGSIALGIVAGLLSTSVQSLGLTLQRKSHILEDEKDPCDVRRPPHRRRRWQLGMGMFIVANILGSSVQISTLPLPVLSTLQASGLVFNSICATLILSEPFTRWSMWGTGLVCTGALLIAGFGAFPAPAHTLTELLALLGRRSFLVWMGFQAFIVVVMAVTTEVVSYLSPHSQNARFRLVRGLAYGCISGILSAHSLLVAKSAVELIIKTISDGDNQFVHWQSWVLVLALVTLALSQLHYLHRGLKLVSTSVLYPLVFCIYNIIAILDGLIYFRQTDLITPLRGCIIALGTVILLSGVLALSWRLSDEQHPPAVGQSSLAPGLGLVEDTEGEDDSVAGSETLLDEDDDGPAVSYQTFGPQDSDAALKNVRLSERAEIWDELDDRQEILPSPATSRRRSTSFPAFTETTALLPSARKASIGSGGEVSEAEPSSATEHGSKRIFRRRRKSTGFPGFRARGSSRGRGLQDAIGGMFKMKWWQGTGQGPSSSLPDLRDAEEEGLVAYRDDLEEAPQHHYADNGRGRARRHDDSPV